MKRRTVVYVACPITLGDTADNIRNCVDVCERLWVKGYAWICPPLTVFFQMVHPHTHEEWMERSYALVQVIDCILRLPGQSVGADLETTFADKLNKKVFENEFDLYREQPEWIDEAEREE